VHGLYNNQGLHSFLKLNQAEDGILVLFPSYITLATPLSDTTWVTKRSAPPNCKAGTAIREVRTLPRAVSN